ncbi:hypothetical protein TRFO_41193 [Tritrichomonas foetus]|uniref:Uncharacterized protein n=1 Tax=Tritrichomonas foetus TaxID=1144522 RepID=A0A1J4L113_9EUKA|nr:hypothetical protein TRFO_41193 [Tritrichomonas foetus]|eukprot:OHT17207.1 hypothetical protein TRFO_41193 [Tritrichomonas foetus]
MCVLLNDYKNKEDEICSLLNIPKLMSTNHFDRIKTAIMNSNQDVDDLQKYIEKIKSHNDDLQNENNQEIQKYDDLASKYEDLKMQMNEIQIQNDDLIHQNNIFLADSKNNAALSQLLSEICQLLKIKPQFSKLDRNSKISNTISDAIENLQLANDEFIEFKNKVHSILKSNDINSTLSKIEHFSQVINELLRLFQAKSTENLIERAKENQKIIHQMSPLMNIFLNSFDNSNLSSFSLGNQNIDEHSKWEQVVKEIIKMKQNNDKLNSLFDSNDFVKTMNSIKRMQNHIKSQENQIQIFEQFEDFVLREFDLHIDSNDQNNFQYQSIKSKITEWKNTNSQFKEIVFMLCKIFDCDPEFICDYVNLMNQTFRRLTKVFNISQKVPAVFSTIEKSINLMKEQNDSLLKKYNEDYLFISNCLPETDLHEQKSQDFIRFSFTKLNNLNTTLKNENNELKKRQIHNDSILVELEDQVQEFNNQNSKLIGLLQLDYDCSFREVLKRIEILNKTEKEFNKLIESHKANSTKTKIYEEKIVNHINAIKQTRNQISSPEEALKLMEKHENHIQRIRDKIGIQNSQFSFVVDKILSVVDLLNSETKSNKKNEYELQSCKNRINDLLSIEKQYSNLFKSQEEKIEELSNEIEQSKLNSQHLTISLYDVFNTLGENVTSTDMAIELIEKLKTQITLLENEISAFKSGTTVDLAFKEMSNKDKKQLKLIKQKIFEQTEYFNSVILKILNQIETRNHNKEEIVRILKEAEIDNYRLLELLDPSIQPNQSKLIPSDSKTTGTSFPSKPIHQSQNKMKIHIGNEFSMNPFQKQSADLFIQRENLIQQPNKKIIDGPIQSIKTKIHRKQKKISLAETSFEKQNFHNNIENRVKQTTLL